MFLYPLDPLNLVQVQPDMDEILDNAEEPDEAESKHSEVKLGKLQYKVTSPDFQLSIRGRP